VTLAQQLRSRRNSITNSTSNNANNNIVTTPFSQVQAPMLGHNHTDGHVREERKGPWQETNISATHVALRFRQLLPHIQRETRLQCVILN
jgi:hypothetical protein